MAHAFHEGTVAWDLNLLTGHCHAAYKMHREGGSEERIIDHLARAAVLADDLAARIAGDDQLDPPLPRGWVDVELPFVVDEEAVFVGAGPTALRDYVDHLLRPLDGRPS